MNELQELEAMLQELTQTLQTVIQSGQQLSENVKLAVAQTLEILFNRIEELRGSETPPVPPTQPKLTESMPSSNVEGFAYDDNSNRLYVRFLGKHPNRYGPVYQYENVPANIFEIFRRGAIPAKTDGKNKWGHWWKGKYPSMGAAMYHLIRAGGFPYQQVA
jgi:hypothetical protein